MAGNSNFICFAAFFFCCISLLLASVLIFKLWFQLHQSFSSQLISRKCSLVYFRVNSSSNYIKVVLMLVKLLTKTWESKSFRTSTHAVVKCEPKIISTFLFEGMLSVNFPEWTNMSGSPPRLLFAFQSFTLNTNCQTQLKLWLKDFCSENSHSPTSTEEGEVWFHTELENI